MSIIHNFPYFILITSLVPHCPGKTLYVWWVAFLLDLGGSFVWPVGTIAKVQWCSNNSDILKFVDISVYCVPAFYFFIDTVFTCSWYLQKTLEQMLTTRIPDLSIIGWCTVCWKSLYRCLPSVSSMLIPTWKTMHMPHFFWENWFCRVLITVEWKLIFLIFQHNSHLVVTWAKRLVPSSTWGSATEAKDELFWKFVDFFLKFIFGKEVSDSSLVHIHKHINDSISCFISLVFWLRIWVSLHTTVIISFACCCGGQSVRPWLIQFTPVIVFSSMYMNPHSPTPIKQCHMPALLPFCYQPRMLSWMRELKWVLSSCSDLTLEYIPEIFRFIPQITKVKLIPTAGIPQKKE